MLLLDPEETWGHWFQLGVLGTPQEQSSDGG